MSKETGSGLGIINISRFYIANRRAARAFLNSVGLKLVICPD
jgi:hypothetical protein